MGEGRARGEVRTLYMSSMPAERTKEEMKTCLTRGTEEEKTDCMWAVVREMSAGKDHSDLLLPISRYVLGSATTRRLKLLFYLYMELVDVEDAAGGLRDEILLVCNSIRKDLTHPNEHLRGRAIRLVSTFQNLDIFDALKAPFLENLRDKNAHTRTVAYVAARRVYRQVEELFEELPELLAAGLQEETDYTAETEGFKSLLVMNRPRALEVYAAEKDATKNRGLIEEFVKVAEAAGDEAFLTRQSSGKDAGSAFRAMLALLRTSRDKEKLRAAVEETIAACCTDYLDTTKKEALAEMGALFASGRFDFDGMAVDLLRMMAGHGREVAEEVVSFVFRIISIMEAKDVFLLLLEKAESLRASPKDLELKAFLIAQLEQMFRMYRISDRRVAELCRDGLVGDSPEVALASLAYLKTLGTHPEHGEVVRVLIECLPRVRFGRILRTMFSDVLGCCGKEDSLLIVRAVGECIESNARRIGQKRRVEDEGSVLQNIGNPKVIFPGILIASLFFKIYTSFEHEREDVVRMIAILLRLCALGKSTGVMDECSRTAIVQTVRGLRALEGGQRGERAEKKALAPAASSIRLLGEEGEQRKKRERITDRVSFGLVKSDREAKEATVQNFVRGGDARKAEDLDNVYQLTSLADPIYCECRVVCSQFEVVLDILFINQTDMALNRVEFDMITSPNIVTLDAPAVDRVPAHTAKTLKCTLKIREAETGFVGGMVTVGKMGERDFFVQHLNEIKFDVADMLRERKIGREDFLGLWGQMQWENLYSLRFRNTRPLEELADRVKASVKGTRIGRAVEEARGEITSLAETLSTSTVQGVDVLLNVLIYRIGCEMMFSCRIRGEREGIVKALSQLVSAEVKGSRAAG